jgi:ABC-2 type transport system permease protein
MMRFLRSAFVIARRDFSATVLSKTFIFFLLAPLFPAAMGGVFGGIGARVASQTERPVVAVIAPRPEFERLAEARDHLAQALGDQALVKIVGYSPERDLGAQQKRLLASHSPPVRAVMSGGLDHPHLTGALSNDPATVDQLKLLLADARNGESDEGPDVAVTDVHASSGSLATDRVTIAWIAQAGLFMLTLLLAPMVMSQLIEEKSNKIIEVIAAAMRIDAMFIGKLFAMLTASIVALIVWMAAGALLLQTIKHGGAASLPSPAVGWFAFLVLALVYFGMNYLLFGAAFLMVGAQASTAREVQTLALPTTFAQMLIFGFAAKSIGNPDSATAIAAAVFPLSSPMAMFARAAEKPELWPHLVAIFWQAVWVALILFLGAKLFRKTVLKSGPKLAWWKFGRA